METISQRDLMETASFMNWTIIQKKKGKGNYKVNFKQYTFAFNFYFFSLLA